ncbi:MAG: sigma-70 family RNA polymerase sigma factor [Planctomycetota bacterium]
MSDDQLSRLHEELVDLRGELDRLRRLGDRSKQRKCASRAARVEREIATISFELRAVAVSNGSSEGEIDHLYEESMSYLLASATHYIESERLATASKLFEMASKWAANQQDSEDARYGHVMTCVLMCQRHEQRFDIAFEKLIEWHKGMVAAVCASIVGDGLCEDVAKDVFSKAGLQISKCERPRTFPKWLKSIAVRESITVTRKTNLATAPLENGVSPTYLDDPSDRHSLEELHSIVRKAGVKEEAWDLVVFWLMGLTHKQIGDKLGIKEGAAKKRWNTLKKKLKNDPDFERMLRELCSDSLHYATWAKIQ